MHSTTIDSDTLSAIAATPESVRLDVPAWLVGLVIAFLFWFFDAFLYCYRFTPGGSLLDAIFLREPFELWMRCVVTLMIISFGVYTDRTIIRYPLKVN